MEQDFDKIRQTTDLYVEMLALSQEVGDAVSLSTHLPGIEALLESTRLTIQQMKDENLDTKELEALRNELFYAKWQMLEKLR